MADGEARTGHRRAEVHVGASTLRPAPRPLSPAGRAVVAEVADRVVGLGADRLRIAVDGPTASGKSSFGDALAAAVAGCGRQVLRASLDDFKRPWRDRHRYDRESGEGYYRNAYDYDAVVDLLLAPAAPAGSGRCALCAIDPLTQVDHSSEITRADPDAVLLVDGVFAFRPALNDHWDLRVWLDIDEATAARRASERDRAWAGDGAEALYRTRYRPAERLYRTEVDPIRLADIVIDNTVFDSPRVLRR